MKHFVYNTSGTCSYQIEFDLDNDVIKNIRFHGGCSGNLLAISKILEGQKTDFVINKLKGNRCGSKSSSCADQLAIAVEKALKS